MLNSKTLLVLLMLMSGSSLALAQGGVVPEPTVTEEQGDTNPDGGFDWGWLGLIGLVGLAGLAGRRR
jgi:MYXO-CTERM domain-containing protein